MAEKTVKAKNIGSVDFCSQLGIIKPGAIGNVTLSESQNHTAKLEVQEEKPAAPAATAAPAAPAAPAAKK